MSRVVWIRYRPDVVWRELVLRDDRELVAWQRVWGADFEVSLVSPIDQVEAARLVETWLEPPR